MDLKKHFNEYFILFSSCIVVEGVRRSIICDLQRGDIYFIPNPVVRLIEKLKIHPYKKVQKKFAKQIEIVHKYLTYFMENELGFWCKDVENFPGISKVWERPEIINNAILEIEELSLQDLLTVLKDLIFLKCKYLELRVYESNASIYEKLESILKECEDTGIRNISLYINYTTSEDVRFLLELEKNHSRLGNIFVHSVPNTIHLSNIEIPTNSKLELVEQKITDNSHCGSILQKYFSVNLEVYTESLAFNTCLNKKIAIDRSGNIKNCPSMKEKYGNVKKDSIKSVIKKEEFRALWNIRKDNIDGCKICEFRYICTDCRAYIEDPKNIYSKPLKCGYNPHTGEWSEWSTNPLKEKTINYYGMRDLTKISAS